jgi:hypothetical protein
MAALRLRRWHGRITASWRLNTPPRHATRRYSALRYSALRYATLRPSRCPATGFGKAGKLDFHHAAPRRSPQRVASQHLAPQRSHNPRNPQ